jgi:hypothetical protein
MKFTKEQIEAYKKKYGRIWLFTSGDKSCICKPAGRNELSLATVCATTMIPGKEPVFDSNKFNESILNSCWIDGDEEIKTDDKYFLGIIEQLQVLVEKSSFEVKEL